MNARLSHRWGIAPRGALLILTLLALSLAGCGGGDGSEAPSGTHESEAAVAIAPVAVDPAARTGTITALVGSITAVQRPMAPSREWRGVSAMSRSPDGRRLAIGSADGSVRVVDAASLGLLATMRGPGASATRGVAFIGGDGARVVSVGRDSQVNVWDSASGRRLIQLNGSEHPLQTVAASPDGAWIVSAGEDTRVMLWDAARGRLARIYTGHRNFVTAAAFSADANLLATGDVTGRIIVWNVDGPAPVRRFEGGHLASVNALAFSPAGGALVSVGQDGRAIAWALASGKASAQAASPSGPLRSVAFNRDGSRMAIGAAGGRVRLLDGRSMASQGDLAVAGGFVNALAFDPDGAMVLADDEGVLRRIDPASGRVLAAR